MASSRQEQTDPKGAQGGKNKDSLTEDQRWWAGICT